MKPRWRLRRVAFVVVLAALLAACERCACDPAREERGAAPRVSAVTRLRLGGPDKATVALTVVRAGLTRRGDGGDLRLVAHAEEALWARGVTLDVTLNTLEPGPLSPILRGATCNVRFLRGGVLNEAELQLMQVDGRLIELGGGAYDIDLSARCAKRVTETAGGKPHAPELPETVTLEASVRLPFRT